MSVSIVIPHFGDAAPTLALIDQLRPQAPHQLIVADDHSPEPFPQTQGVSVVRRASNGGFGSAVNAGAKVATGDFLLVLNSDLDVGPTFLADLVEAALPWQPAVVSPAIIDSDGSPGHTARRFPTIGQQATEWLTPLARFRDTPAWHRAVGHEPVSDDAAPADWLVGAALLIPMDAFRAVNGFDEGYFMNVEEVDLQRRLRTNGVLSVRVPNVVVTHIGGGSSDPGKRRGWVVSSRMRYARRWGGANRLRLTLTAVSAANLLWNAGRTVLGRPARPITTAREELDLIWGT